MTRSHFHILTIVVLYPENKVSAGVADGFHCYARILLNWCLGKQLPCRTGGKTTGEINSKYWTIHLLIDLFLKSIQYITGLLTVCAEKIIVGSGEQWCSDVSEWSNRAESSVIPETLSSSLMNATLPLAVILIRPDQSGFSSFQSAAL